MAVSNKVLKDALRAKYTLLVARLFEQNGEEVLYTNSNEVTFPVVDAEGNEAFVTITVKVPSGSRDGDPYDGYAMAQEYAMKVAKRKRIAEEREKKKKA